MIHEPFSPFKENGKRARRGLCGARNENQRCNYRRNPVLFRNLRVTRKFLCYRRRFSESKEVVPNYRRHYICADATAQD